MNLLYVIAAYGPAYMAGEIHRELGQELVRQGEQFAVLAFESERDRRARKGQTDAWGGDPFVVERSVTAGRLHLDLVNRMARPLLRYERFLPAWSALSRRLREAARIDLVLAEGAYPFGAVTALACVRRRLPYVVTVAGGDFIASHDMSYGYGRFAFARRLMRFALGHAAAVRATSTLGRESAIALGANPGSIVVVPRNVGAAVFKEARREGGRARARAELEARWGLPPGPLLACAGRLHPIKGFADAIRAVSRLRPEFPNLRLLVAGPDRAGHRQELQSLAEGLGVADAVVLPGALPAPDLHLVLAAADLVLVPSVVEGMNKVAVEAAALGTPSVVTRTTGIADALGGAGAASITEPQDPVALASCTAALLRDPARRSAMGAAGAVFAEQFRPERIAGQVRELCAGVLARDAARG